MSNDQIHRAGTRRRAPSIRRLLVIAATIAALSMLAPTASASEQKPFHLAKVCDDTGCTVTWSSYKAIPAGTHITYEGSSADALVATVHVAHGTAKGNCNILSVFVDGSPGTCIFGTGTGSLTSFRAELAVSLDVGTGVWYWDGTTSHGDGD